MTNEEPTAAPIPPQRPGQTPVPPVQPPTVAPPTQAIPPVQPPSVVPPIQAAPPVQLPPAQLPPMQAQPNYAPTQPVPAQGVPAYGQQQAVVGQPMLLDQPNQSPAAETTEIVRKSNTGMRLGLAGALLAVTGLGGFAVKTALSEPAGPETPEEAMEAFFEALANEDLVGMAETLLPSEREAYIDPMLTVTDELERLEIFGKDVEIDSLGTLDITVEELVVQSTPLAEGFATVESISGTVHVIGGIEDVEALATLGEWLGEEPEPATDEVTNLADDPMEMVAVEEDGVWYLSLTYSIAEEAREDEGKPLPVFGGGPTPIGGATPEAAIENFANEMVDLDLEGMLTQLDPEEMRALYDYAPLFLPSTQDEIDGFLNEIRDEGVTWGITDLQLRTDDSRGRTIVLVDGATFEASFEDDYVILSFTQDCVSIKAAGDMLGDLDESFCEGDALEGDEIDPLAELGLDHIEFPDLGITVVQRGENWYISSAPTVLYSMVDLLAVLEPADIQTIKDKGEEFIELFDPTNFDLYSTGLFGQSTDTKFTEVDERIEPLEDTDGYGTGGEDEYETNFVDVNPSYVPDGYDAYSEDTGSWWFTVGTDSSEPVSLMSVWTDDAWVTVAEFPTNEVAIMAMNQLPELDFVGDQDQASDSFNIARRSGRFVLTYWEDDPAAQTFADLMAAHLAEQ